MRKRVAYSLVAAVGTLLWCGAAVAKPNADAPRYGGFHIMADYYPPKGGQQSVYTGLRIFLSPGTPYVAGLFDVGYVAAGPQAGSGDDGIGIGFGLEARFPFLHGNVIPFGRIELERRVSQTSDPVGVNATLFVGGGHVAIGAHLAKAVELHVDVGNSYSAGVLANGFGIGIGYLF